MFRVCLQLENLSRQHDYFSVIVFIDKNTPRPFIEDLSVYGDDGGAGDTASVEDHVLLDAMGLGMGCCCLQVTFQAQSIDEARFLYDQLTPLTPIILALSASSPIWRGYLTDIDCRWNVLCAMVDDRTGEERGFEVNYLNNKLSIFP